jgi:acid phosphatase type 7
MVSENSPAEGPKVGYYSLNFPAGNELSGETTPWRLIALDSGKETPSPSQLGWLEQDLKLNRQRCVLAFAHFFAFSSSRHGHEPPDFKHADKKNSKKEPKPDTNMVAVVQMLYSSGASLLLSGHDHGYEQFKRQDAAGKPAGDGVRAFVVGTGGATFYGETYEKKWPNSEKRQSRWHGVLKLELFETRYRWRFVPIDMIASKVPDDLKAPSEEECNSRKE